LLRLLTQRLQSPAWAEHGRRVGDIFLKIAPFFKLYAAYVGNCTRAERGSNHSSAAVPLTARAAFALCVAEPCGR